MIIRKHLNARIITVCTIVLLIVLLLNGCSIPSRASMTPSEINQPAAPVLGDVYDRSVNKDVYSKPYQSGERIIPKPSLKTENPLRDAGQ